VLIFLAFFSSKMVSQSASVPDIGSYREVPGLTDLEKTAIARLKGSRSRLILAVTPSTENFIQADGTMVGSSVNTAHWLSEFFSVPFEVRIVEPDHLYQALDSKEVDFTSSLTTNQKHKQSYFMTEPIVNRSVMFASRKSDPDILEDSFQGIKRVGVLPGALDIALVQPFLPPESVQIPVSNFADAIMRLNNREIDLFFFQEQDRFFFENDQNIVCRTFLPLIYIQRSLTTRDESLVPIITVLNKYIDAGGLALFSELFEEGELAYRQYLLYKNLNPDEKEYLAQHHRSGQTVKTALEFDNYPMCFYNESEKQWQGIAIDVLAQIEILTGLKFEPINSPGDSWPHLMELLLSDQAQLTSELLKTEDRISRFLWADEPYSADFYAMMSVIEYPDISINQLPAQKVGLVAESGPTDMFFRWFPQHERYTMFRDLVAGFDSLERGEIDLLMSSRNQLALMTNWLERPIFRVNVLFPQPSDSYFGFNINESLLKSVVSKAQKLIACETISDSWSRRVFDYRGKLARAQVPYLVGLSILLVSVLLLVMIMLQHHRHIGKRLEATVLERTRELAIKTKTAQEAEAAAQMASRAKSEFLANVSHELLTPLSAILGLTHLTLETELNELQFDYLNRTEQSARTLLATINDLLDFSKIEAGRMVIEEAPFKLDDLIASAVQQLAPAAEKKGVELILDIYENVPFFLIGDPGRLSQILAELVSNAVKFTEKGQIIVSVQVIEEQEKNVFLKFSVQDTGIGLEEKQKENIFTAFSQADGSTTRKYGGSGLGLVISKRLSEMMGGRIWCESRKGVGSTFVFTSLFQKQSPQDQEAELPPLAIRQPFLGLRAMAIDDNPMALAILEKALTLLGFSTVKFDSGEGALTYFLDISQDNKIDLIVVDWKMPGLDGIETIKRLRTVIESMPRVLMLTAYSYSDIAQEAGKAGIKNILNKPISLTGLHDSLLELLGGAKKLLANPKHSQLAVDYGLVRDIKGAYLLLAEDNEISQLVTSRLLNKAGFRFKVARNGQEAVDLIQAETFDLILMDVHMPEMDGLTATAVIRSFSQYKDLPIVAMTANAVRGDRERCLEAGMNDHINKPIDINELFKILVRWIPSFASRTLN
jgi:signal transduction histidine kinase/DNA-binding response OmpR family regulator